MSKEVPSIWLETPSKLLIAGFYRQWNAEDSGKSIPDQLHRLTAFLNQVDLANNSGADLLILADWNINSNMWTNKDYPYAS